MLGPWQADKAEELVEIWIRERMAELYPTATEFAPRLVRTIWLNHLESEAIIAWEQEDTNRMWYQVSSPLGAYEAVAIASGDHPHEIPNEEREAAMEFLRKMKEGEEKPNVEEILEIAKSVR